MMDALVAKENSDVCILTIGVCIWNTYEAVVPVDIDPMTTTADVCRYVAFSLSLTVEDCDYYRLVLVCTMVNQLTHANYHHVRTLDSDEIIFNVAKTVGTKEKSKYSKYSFKDVTWYFKDIRSIPISFNNEEISGSSSDEEETQYISVSNDDLSYIMESDRRGYLYKRSSKDPNVWRRRFCALTDKFWCINTKRKDFRAICIPLNDDVVVQDSTPSFNFPHVIVVHSPWKVRYFRANSKTEQQGWVADLNERAQLSKENDIIHMAEVICCDEEATANERILKVTRPLLESDAVQISLIALDINYHGNRHIRDTYFKAGFDMDSDSDDSGYSTDSDSPSEDGAMHRDRRQIASSSSSHSNQVDDQYSDGNQSRRNTASYYSNKFSIDSPAFAMSINNPSSFRYATIQYFRYSLLDSNRYNFSNPATHLNLSRTGKSFGVSLVHALHDMNPSLATILNFVNAVQRYKSLHRRDISVPNRVLWLEAATVFNRYLSKVPIMSKGRNKRHSKRSPSRKNNNSPNRNTCEHEEFDAIYDHGLVFIDSAIIEIVRDELVAFVILRTSSASSPESPAASASSKFNSSLITQSATHQQPANHSSSSSSSYHAESVYSLLEPMPSVSGFWSWFDTSFSVTPVATPIDIKPVDDCSNNNITSTATESSSKHTAEDTATLTELELDGWLGLMNVCVPAAVESAAGMYRFIDKQPSLTLFDEIVEVISRVLQSDKLSLQGFHQLCKTMPIADSFMDENNEGESFAEEERILFPLDIG